MEVFVTVSIIDVAKKCGLSTVTVSRVINNSPNVRPANREKVLAAIKELGYCPNAAARSLVRGKTGVIGVVIPCIHDVFFNKIVQAINQNLIERDYYMALFLVDENFITDGYNQSFLREKRVDGMLVLTHLHRQNIANMLEQQRMPSVMLVCQQPDYDGPAVYVDNFSGGYEAGQRLVELGHKRIGIIDGPLYLFDCTERTRGCIAALKEAGLEPCRMDRVSDFTEAHGYKMMEQWVAQGDLPTAVFCCDDHNAAGAILALREHSIQVPQDVSIIGFDGNTPFFGGDGFISSIEQPMDEIGSVGVQMLLKQIDGEPLEHTRVVLHTTYRDGSTTAPPKSE